MRLQGRVSVPGDKSISHRALAVSSISRGTSVIYGLNEGVDCSRTLECLQALGVALQKKEGCWQVAGRGPALQKADDVLYCGNSGATLRLLAGLLAGQDFLSILDGDQSLRSRPMARIVEPLRRMGADLYGAAGSNLAPLSVRGGAIRGIRYELPVPNSQVKSAILLAGLQAEGTTVVVEPIPCSDHIERMLLESGADLQVGRGEIQITGGKVLEGRVFEIPGDLSAAAFVIGAAVLLPGSELIVENVGLNPTRTGFLDVLGQMGARIEIEDVEERGGEPLGTIVARGEKRELEAARVEGKMIPRLADEIPMLAVMATQACGTTVIRDAEELRVKESDRLANLALELSKMGAQISELPDGLEITGPTKLRGAAVQSHGDHRLALALAVASLLADGTTRIEKKDLINSSFPGFHETFKKLIAG